MLYTEGGETLICYPQAKEATEHTVDSRCKLIRYPGFEDCRNLKTITLPESVETIGASSFSGCEELEELNLSEGLQSIGEAAFEGC